MATPEMPQKELIAGLRKFGKEHNVSVLTELPEKELIELMGRSKRLAPGGAIQVVLWRLTGTLRTWEAVTQLGGTPPAASKSKGKAKTPAKPARKSKKAKKPAAAPTPVAPEAPEQEQSGLPEAA